MSNRLLGDRSQDELRHALALSQCRNCGLIQLAAPIPPSVLKPPVEVAYNEPEGHLDAMVAALTGQPGFNQDAAICGLTYKDASTVQRFSAQGYLRTMCLGAAPARERGCVGGMEMVQQYVSEGGLADAAARWGKQDVLIVRHILEHAHDLRAFLAGLAPMVHARGCVVLEVPDFTNSLAARDYSTVWEEHTAYFTPETLRSALRYSGLEIQYSDCYPYAIENSIVVVARRAQQPTDGWAPGPHARDEQLERAHEYAMAFPAVRKKWVEGIAARRARGERIAILGAGHLAITFVNVFGLAEWIDFVADDDPAKQGRFLPGSRLPVHPCDALYHRSVGICLLAVPPESEHKVLRRHHQFVEKGGVFASIFGGRALVLDEPARRV